VESRLEEGCYYLLFDSRTHRGANQAVRQWVSHVLSPSNLIYHAEEQYQTYWFPAYGLLPRWHHARPAHCDKPAGLESITLTYYRDQHGQDQRHGAQAQQDYSSGEMPTIQSPRKKNSRER
jgi:SgrR family transcriptional regulator